MSKLSLKINDRFENRTVNFFNDFRINLKHNSVGSTFAFNFLYDPNNKEHIELACVSHFHEVQMFFGDNLLMTGNIVNNSFKAGPTKTISSFGGYSKPGVLDDCNIPPSLYPLQFDGLSLEQIASKLIRPFKLDMIIDSSVQKRMSKSFKTSTASSSSSIKDYLTELATQKNIVLSHDNKGRLLFTESKTKQTPILDFDLTKPTPAGMTFELNYNGQGMHSHITVMKQASINGGNAGEETTRNPYVIGSYYRPRVTSQTSGDDIDTTLASKRVLANELRNLTLTITTDKWVIDGVLMLPNNLISIYAPELFIFTKTNFFIESINFEGNNQSTIATINCVLPEVYNNETPISIYKGINEQHS